MNKDLDFIKDKLAESDIKAPADMDESFVMKRLEGVQPKIADSDLSADARVSARAGIGSDKRTGSKRRWVPIAAAAAAVVLVAAIGVAIGARGIGKPRTVTLPGGLSLIQFRNHNEIKNAVKEIKDAKYAMDIGDYIEEAQGLLQRGADYNTNSREAAASDSASASSSGTADSSFSETYKQVDGVDEADIIKTDGRYIYCVENSYQSIPGISIFSAEGEDSQRVAEIRNGRILYSTPDEAAQPEDETTQSIVNDIYVRDDRLIAICSFYKYGDHYSEMTQVTVYDIGDINNITLLDSFTQSGWYRSSRMIGDELYTVTSYYASSDDSFIPACGRGEDPEDIPADSVYCLAYPEDDSFLVVSGYNTLDYSAQTESKAILGTVDDIYCNLDNMYIYSTVYNYSDSDRWYDGIFGIQRNDGLDSSTVSSQIMKVSLTDGIGFTAYTEIDGRIDNQYALDETDGNLRVATTSRIGWKASNTLYVLDGELSVIGRTEDFAQGEEIKAVRYVGDTAYVITYEQTDPLFVIDLSDPVSPKLLGSVEITGFSTMLVPIDENTVLGIGYHDEDVSAVGDAYRPPESGFKLALFDVSDRMNPRVLDSRSYVDYNSEVMYNPKALVYNPDRGDFIVPLNYSNYYGVYDYGNDTFIDYNEAEGGILNFRIEDGKIIETDHYKTTHNSIDRCVYVGDTIYMTYTDDGGLNIETVPYK